MEMGIGVTIEAIEISTIAGCLIDLESKPEMTYGEKAKVVYDLTESFDHARKTLDKLGEWEVTPNHTIIIKMDSEL